MVDSSENHFQHSFLPITSINSGSGLEVKPDLFSLTIQIVNVCFIGKKDNPTDWLLVDAGMPHSADAIIAAAEERFGEGCKPKAIVLTHGHFDHVGAIVDLLEKWGDLPVYAHPLEHPYLNGEKDYPTGDPTVDGGLVSELSPLFPNHGINIGNRLKELPEDGTIPGFQAWCWIHTPGHTPGHISLFREEDRALIVGDAFVTVKQESLFKVIMQEKEISGPPKYFTSNWSEAEESVRRLEKLMPSTAISGHGIPMEGEQLANSLAKLAHNFEEIAIPKHDRYLH